MKAMQHGIVIILILILNHNGAAQGTFQNLNFEAADLSGYSPGDEFVPIAYALPGWSGVFTSSTSTSAATQVWYDGSSLGGAMITVIDSNSPGLPPIQGVYSACVFGGGG